MILGNLSRYELTVVKMSKALTGSRISDCENISTQAVLDTQCDCHLDKIKCNNIIYCRVFNGTTGEVIIVNTFFYTYVLNLSRVSLTLFIQKQKQYG